MDLAVSVKLAPGVRLRATSRGIRATIDPTAGRGGVGSALTGFSTGIDPVSYDAIVSGSIGAQPRSAPEPASPTLTQLKGQTRAADKADTVLDVLQTERLMTTRHLANFPVTQQAFVPDPKPLDVDRVEEQFLPQAMANVGWFNRGRRNAARQDARTAAIAFADQQLTTAREEADRLQQEYDAYWNALNAHDRDAVVATVDDALTDIAPESTCVDAGMDPFTGRYVSCVVTFGQPDLVPEQTVATTATGRPELQKRSKLDVNNLYVDALASTVLATVRETLAVAPATDEVRIVAVRKEAAATGALPSKSISLIYTGVFLRREMQTVHWQTVDLEAELLRAMGAELVREGPAQTVVPLGEDAHRRMFAVLHAFSETDDRGRDD